MNLHKPKTKFIEIKVSLSGQAHMLMLEGEIIEKVNSVKQLGILFQDDLKLNTNVDKIVLKGSQRLRFTTVSKKAGMDQTQLLKVYFSRIRLILEYACQVWSPGLTSMQEYDIEQVQKRALWAISPSESYAECLELSKLTPLKERQVHLLANLYKKIKDNCTNPLHCHLPVEKVRFIASDPPKRELSIHVLNVLMEV